MPYGDQDKMIDDLLASMNVGLTSSRDKATINGQLAKKALEYKMLTPEYEAKIKADEEAEKQQRIKANGLTAMGENATTKQDTSGGNDFNINADDVADIISSMMA